MENIEQAVTVTEEPQVNQEPATEPKVEVQEDKPSERMFTQKEVDEIIKQRLARVEKKKPTVEEDVEGLKRELETWKQEAVLKDYDFSKNEFKDYVKYKVSQMVSEEKDFGTCLNEFMSGEGKEFLRTAEPKTEVKTTPRPDNLGGAVLTESQQYVLEKYGKKI